MILNKVKEKLSHFSVPAFIYILILVGFCRYLPLELPEFFNFSPVLAIFLLSGAYLKGYQAWATPIFAVLVSDFFLAKNYNMNFFEPFMLSTFFSYLLIFWIGKKFALKRNLKNIFVSCIVSALLFHFVTCALSWWINPAYAKTISGLIQSLVIGEPGYAPSYLFLRNSMLGTVFFGLLLSLVGNMIENFAFSKQRTQLNHQPS